MFYTKWQTLSVYRFGASIIVLKHRKNKITGEDIFKEERIVMYFDSSTLDYDDAIESIRRKIGISGEALDE